MRYLLALGPLFVLAACSPEPETQDTDSVAPSVEAVVVTEPVANDSPTEVSETSATETDPVLELDWDALIPADFQPDNLLDQYNVDEMADDDPRTEELMEKLEAMWRNAPAVETLEGSRVKLPGFVVPLENDGDKITDFLLVPYFGACIHVPPPPANQIVYVESRGSDAEVRQEFDTVWVTGRMRIERTASDMGEAGYRMEASLVEPYE